MGHAPDGQVRVSFTVAHISVVVLSSATAACAAALPHYEACSLFQRIQRVPTGVALLSRQAVAAHASLLWDRFDTGGAARPQEAVSDHHASARNLDPVKNLLLRCECESRSLPSLRGDPGSQNWLADSDGRANLMPSGGVWEDLFPGVHCRVLGATPMFYIPFCREICLWMSVVDAGAST